MRGHQNKQRLLLYIYIDVWTRFLEQLNFYLFPPVKLMFEWTSEKVREKYNFDKNCQNNQIQKNLTLTVQNMFLIYIKLKQHVYSLHTYINKEKLSI